MSNIVYTKLSTYLESVDSITARIAVMEAIASKMLDAMDAAASTGQFESYKLDTGQTRTEITYRSLAELANAYNILIMRIDRERVKADAKCHGRVFRLVDGRNFRG